MIAMIVGTVLALLALAYVLYPLVVSTTRRDRSDNRVACPSCGSPLEAGASFCSSCGSPVAQKGKSERLA